MGVLELLVGLATVVGSCATAWIQFETARMQRLTADERRDKTRRNGSGFTRKRRS
ncbi:MAG: hypothetical protein OWT28_11800 [Firmicutes bacterium]|nr:hypothetical protein [Bacillota bacterium]